MAGEPADGDAYFRSGKFESAIAAWSGALEHLDGKDPQRRIDLVARRAEGYQALGHYQKAISDLRIAIKDSRQAGDAFRLALLQGSLGNVLRLSGALREARTELLASLAFAEENKKTGLVARNRNNLGNLLIAQNRRFEAAAEFEKAIAKATATGDDQMQAIALLNLSRVSLLIDRHGAAETQAKQALEILQRQDNSYQKAVGLISGARVLRTLRKGAYSAERGRTMFEALREALRIAEMNGDVRNLSYASGELGRIYEDQGRYGEAITLTRRALFHAQVLNAHEILYLWHWQLGRIYRAIDNVDSALAAYRRSVSSLREIRSELLVAAISGGRSFRETVAPVLIELVDLLLRQSESAGNARLVQARLNEARSTVELFKTAELEDYFRDDCVSTLQAKVKQVDRVVKSDTAAVYPIILPDRIEVLLSLPAGLSRTTVPVSVRAVNAEIIRFTELIQEYWSPSYLSSAQKLYDWLIAPIEPKLQSAGISTLVFIPDGLLRTLPISALHDGTQHLVAKYALAVAPGLTLLDPRPLGRGKLDPLLSGLTRSVQGFTALPKVNAELAEIRKVQGGKLLKDRAFTTPNLRTELTTKPYSVIHIASHAQFDKDPKKSFILTYDGQLNMDGLERFIKLSRFRDEPVELLTLSACTTAAGDDRSALGLSGLAIKSGARSALGSLWSIEDNSTSILMAKFYDQLLQTELSKAEALRRAQISMLRHEQFHHPFFWSAFILIGNWL